MDFSAIFFIIIIIIIIIFALYFNLIHIYTMKRLFTLVLVLGALTLTSCATHFYNTSNMNQSKTEVVLAEKNFKVVGQAEGTATATYICGIGGLSHKAIRSNAVAEMFKSANLKGSQTIININVKSSVGGVPPFFVRQTYTATGTIIEFTE